MFGGYYGRRRSKTALFSIVGLLILLAIIYRWQFITSYQFRFNHFNKPRQVPIKHSPQLNRRSVREEILPVRSLLQEKPNSVLSSIEFLNPPYLTLEVESPNIIPILVLSKASNIEVRDAIRRTWAFDQSYGNDTLQTKIFFLIGVDDFIIQRTRTEQILFDDVIQVSIPDMYSYSAYKELSAMMWVRSYLPNAPFYIKTEDDVIVNMKALVNHLLPTIEQISTGNLVIGWFGSEHLIPRSTYQKFVDAVLPPTTVDLQYAMSLLYAVTSKGADNMLDALSHVEFIEHPGDPFVTGILRDAAHVQINNLASSPKNYKYELANGPCREAFEKNSKLLLCTSSLHVGSSHSVTEYFEAWNTLVSQG
jgi:hypothetical protein